MNPADRTPENEDLYEFDESVPRGYLRAPDGKLHRIITFTPSGMPMTGDDTPNMGIGIALLTALLGALAWIDFALRSRKKESNK